MNAPAEARHRPFEKAAAGHEPDAAAVGAGEGTTPRGWVRWIWLAYLLIYPLPWFVRKPTVIDVVVSCVAMAVFLWLYLHHWEQRRGRLLATALLVVAISFGLQPFGGLWGVFTVYGVAMVANLRPTRHAVGAIVGISVALVAFALGLGLHWSQWAFTLFMGIMVGASSVMYAQLEDSNQRLAQSREQARALAVVAERERIARDLHDLLGHTLTVVAVKADLAAKLIDRDPSRAAAEVDDIRTTARAALADIRAAVTGMRSTTLVAEVAQARMALSTAGVELQVEGLHTPLPAHVEAALSLLIREGVTNVVRHATATRCNIRIERSSTGAVLEVVDDGQADAPIREGQGLRGMRTRVQELQGSFTIASATARGLDNASGTRLRAEIPLPESEGAAT